MGWVSLFDPDRLAKMLRLPEGSRPIAILCLGRVQSFYDRPMLEEQRWAHRMSLQNVVTDYWAQPLSETGNRSPESLR
jgi:5,6-dimethylbenzimidazole synthase